MSILFEFSTLLALIVMFPFRTRGLTKSLKVAGFAALIPVTVKLFKGTLASKK